MDARENQTKCSRRWILRRRLELCLAFAVLVILFSSLWMGMTLQNQSEQSSLSIPLPIKTKNNSLPILQRQEELKIIDQLQPPTDKNIAPAQANNLWDNNPSIPDWMKEYFDWHTQQLSKINETNWKSFKYFILSCKKSYERCGGVSDRLKPVPLLILSASRSQRLFFIHWEKPCNLEEFLVPPKGGFQWSAPNWLQYKFEHEVSNGVLVQAKNVIEKSAQNSQPLLYTHLHDTKGGETQYDAELGDGSFSIVYHDLFRILFQPAVPLQSLIYRKLKSSHLVPGKYVTAHYRAEYGREVARHPTLQKPTFLRKVAHNAIRCASKLQPGAPIYFASDNAFAKETIKQWALDVGYPIIQFEREEDVVLNLDDMGNDTISYSPSDYYSTFVDLYLAGNGNCVTYGRGGFGRFASLLSFNVSCNVKHVKNFFPQDCKGLPPFDQDYEK